MTKLPVTISIDLEDFSQDYRRYVAGAQDYRVRTEALWSAYRKIEAFCQSRLGGRRMTFFTTGVLAHHFPDLIGAIASDGHEIGCHYYFHDNVGREDPVLFGQRLDQAIDALSAASRQEILGFRAPNLSITRDMVAHYREIAKRFSYDSSLAIETAFSEFSGEWNDITLDGKMRLFPVAMDHRFGGRLKVRSGGSYMKLFPIEWTIATLKKAYRNSFMPAMYLHPYEFVDDQSFWVTWSELEGAPLPRRALSWARQLQWHVVGNRGIPAKLARTLEEFEHIGPMKMLLENAKTMPIAAVPVAP